MAQGNMIVTLVANTRKWNSGLTQAGNATTKFGRFAQAAFTSVVALVGVAAVAFARFAKTAIDDASSLQQSIGGVESVFKNFSSEMLANSELAADSVGLSMEQYQRLGTMTATLLKNAGTPMKELVDQTDILITLASDLAATFGGTVEEAATAMNAALRGEFEPIRRFGIALSVAAIQEEALTMAHKNSITELTKRDKVLATQALLLQQGADASGQFARESETLAQRQQVLDAKWKNLSATLGEDLLPIAETLTGVLIDLVDSPQFKKGLDRLVQGFKDFGIWLTSPEGIKKIDELATSLTTVSDALINIIGWLKALSEFSPAGWLVDLFSNGKTKNGYVIPFGNPGPAGGPPPRPNPTPNRPRPGTEPFGGTSRGLTVNFNAPIDSVSAGREVARVLSDYNRSNGRRR